jgi:hypothetical protein
VGLDCENSQLGNILCWQSCICILFQISMQAYMWYEISKIKTQTVACLLHLKLNYCCMFIIPCELDISLLHILVHHKKHVYFLHPNVTLQTKFKCASDHNVYTIALVQSGILKMSKLRRLECASYQGICTGGQGCSNIFSEVSPAPSHQLPVGHISVLPASRK